jgi:hypothetical protein
VGIDNVELPDARVAGKTTLNLGNGNNWLNIKAPSTFGSDLIIQVR